MKTFHFRLERVLAWRSTQLALEEAKAEQIQGGLRVAGEAKAEVARNQAEAVATALQSPTISGATLGELEASRIWANREEKRLAARMAELQQSLVVQYQTVANVRRGVKLVERLREKKLDAWKVEAGAEVDALAAESAIAQWRRLNP